jgi:hypothetical protein
VTHVVQALAVVGVIVLGLVVGVGLRWFGEWLHRRMR